MHSVAEDSCPHPLQTVSDLLPFSSIMLFIPWTLVPLAAVVSAEHWIFGGVRPIATTRLDPVSNPNAVCAALISLATVCGFLIACRQIGSHVHSIVGASRFKDVYNPVDLVQSNCTTIPVQPDKSNYWAVGSSLFPL